MLSWLAGLFHHLLGCFKGFRSCSQQSRIQLLLVLDDEASVGARLVSDHDLLPTRAEVRVAADNGSSAVRVLRPLAVRALVLEVVGRVHHHPSCCCLNFFRGGLISRKFHIAWQLL